jgi:hypothetical protein
LPERVRLINAPGELRDREVAVLGWTTEQGETALICRLTDGSAGTLPGALDGSALAGRARAGAGRGGVAGGLAVAACERGEGLSGRRPRRGRASAENGGGDVGAARARDGRGDAGGGGGVVDAAGRAAAGSDCAVALEVSRLARSSADWHQLLDLCALTGTLIADSDGIYSPSDFNDRLLLGLKGTMSEAELHLIRSRLDGGLRTKAQRGELAQNFPVGLDRDEDGRIVLSADEQVRHAIERVFVLWRRLGSARQVVRELVAEEQKLPRRTVGSRRVRWARASYGAVHD